MAIPYSYEGVIKAIKANSGSTKFYKPSFQGIIESIQDWGAGVGSIEVLPPGSSEPNTGNESDGDMIAIPNSDGNYFLYVYADGAWQRIHVTTEEVETIGTAPFIDLDGETFNNQHEVNVYIWDHLREIEAKGYDDSLLWKDQKRQDDDLQEVKEKIWPDFDDPCPTAVLSGDLKHAWFTSSGDLEKFHFTVNGSDNEFAIPQPLQDDSWPPYGDADAIYINGDKYNVLRKGNVSGIHWKYYIDKEVPSELFNTTIKVSLCEPYEPEAIFVTHEELAKDQERQDDAFAKGQATQNDAFAKGQAAQDDVFAKGQATQDDAFAKGQATQDKALRDEIDARAERDLQHDAQISTIEYKLDTLLGLQFRGAYRFKHEVDCDTALLQCYQNANGDINAQLQCNKDQVACEQGKVTSGVFEAVDPDDRFDHLLSIVLHKIDLSGVETEWGNVLAEGDYLEIDHQIGGVADKTNYGLYRITAEPEITQNALGEDVYSFQLQFLQGDGEMLQDEIYEIRGINKDEGVNPEELADFLTKDDAQKTYLPLIGGELTGTLKMKDANVVQTRHLDSGQNTDLQIKRQGQRRILVGSEKVVFDVPPECGSPIKGDNQLVTKKYVDANKGTGPKGEKGSPGAGTQGAKGNRGYTGGSGSKGNRGSSGSKGNRGADMVMSYGTSSNPSLSTGKMYLNTTYKVLYIGV